MANPPVLSAGALTRALIAARQNPPGPYLPGPPTFNGRPLPTGKALQRLLEQHGQQLAGGPNDRPGPLGATPPAPVAHVRPNDRPGPLGPGPLAPAPGRTDQGGDFLTSALPPGLRPPATGGGLRPPVSQPTDMQLASQQVNALLNPLIKNISDQENARALAGQQAIAGYTSAEQALLGQYAPQVAGEYAGASQSQNAIDAALRASLTGAGGDAANQLGSKLSAISADPQTAARVNAAAGATTQGAANTGYALGSASLSALGQQGAAGQQFAGALPGIAGLSGLQSSKALQSQVASELATKLGDISSQAPGMIQNVLGSIQDRKAAEAKVASDAALADRKNQIAALIASGRTKEALQLAQMNNQTKVAIANANNKTKADIANQNAQLKASSLQVAQGRSDRTYRLQFAKTFGYDPVSGKVTPGFKIDGQGHVVKAGSAGRTPQLSAKQVQDYRGTAATIAENSHNGFSTTDKNGTVTKHPALTYKQALDEMDKEGVPRPIAVQYLNRWYPAATTVGGKSQPGATGLGVTVQSPGER